MNSDLAMVLVRIDATYLESHENEEPTDLEECHDSKDFLNEDEKLQDGSSFDPSLKKLNSFQDTLSDDLIEKYRKKSLSSLGGTCNERRRPAKVPFLPSHPYRCSLCNFTTSDLEIIVEHSDTYHQEDMYITCSVCMCFKSSIMEVVKHQASEHNKVEFNKYLKFKSSISEADIAAKYLINNVFSCDKCAFEDKNYVKFRAHKKTVHNDSLYMCSQCDFSVCDMSTLRSHISNYHLQITPFKCPFCKYCSYNADNVVAHADVHEELVNPKGCSLCDYKTKYAKRLRWHLLMHLKHLTFECFLCHKTVKRMVDIVKHFKQAHSLSVLKANKCVQCPLAFKLRKDLVDHEHLEHSPLKPYSCSLCFFSSNTVKRFAEHCNTVHDENDLKKLVKFDHSTDQVYIDTLERFLSLKPPSEDDNYKKQYCTFERPSSLLPKASSQRYSCKICRFQTSKGILLESHMRDFHSNKKEAASKRNFPKKRPSDEFVSVENKSESPSTLRTSKRKRCTPIKYQENLRCDMCNFHATTLELLSKHKLVFHKRKLKSFISPGKNRNSIEPPMKKEKLIEPSTESVPIDSSSERNDELIEEERKRPKRRPKKAIKNGISKSLEGSHNGTELEIKEEEGIEDTAHSEQFLDCHLCDFRSMRADVLYKHMYRIHLEVVGKKTCYHCKMQFDDIERLRFHVAIAHDEEETLMCGFCGLSIPTDHLFEAHLQYKHHRETNLECAHCNNKFRSLKLLKYHMKDHMDDIEKMVGKLFPCAYCSFGAEKFDQLNDHVKEEHPDCEVMKCKFCSFVATYKSSFRKHLFNKHHRLKEFQCPFCDYCTAFKEELKNHARRNHSHMLQ